ncbi:hypothetical protein ASPZODRAFT_128053 [Penicilliopsis zonata CBS 506.65]|uniref:Uncharacterized protein n=1 Tax=Penicilliopsis zonata CBS 506.65 TaxID=1073090 RepID=A0A1L9SR23_9EURO|nr:hypothetical protein ASPZODRAFT_128053 [Penicilliopsis zonata CBS 506.65]OJJ49566.1 hypothetical protein ASPZODRAFT_128053 [Penicilliopsis zonata CBS 506.65]
MNAQGISLLSSVVYFLSLGIYYLWAVPGILVNDSRKQVQALSVLQTKKFASRVLAGSWMMTKTFSVGQSR